MLMNESEREIDRDDKIKVIIIFILRITYKINIASFNQIHGYIIT